MNWNTIGLCIDFGLVVLIWMVQLIVYPSFSFYSKHNLKEWHLIYTKNISLIVIPLMLFQLGLTINDCIGHFSFYNGCITILILSIWIITFLKFVPLHTKIDVEEASSNHLKTLKELIQYNWLRTILWSLIFILNVYFF